MPAKTTILARAIGGAGAILLMEWLAGVAHAPLMTIPFATSIVMVMGSPDAPPARLRCLVGGHVICAACGILCTVLLGFELWVAAVAIGCAIALMHVFDAFHPPAGIGPIIIASTKATPLFILSPILTGVAILAAYALLYHRVTGEKWPRDWH
jgi:CBS-domain-containing membrane protein